MALCACVDHDEATAPRPHAVVDAATADAEAALKAGADLVADAPRADEPTTPSATTSAVEALPEAARKTLGAAPLPTPLLLPELPGAAGLLSSAVVVRRPTWVSVQLRDAGLSITVFARALARLNPALAAELGGALPAESVSEAHDVWTLGFFRFGAHYSLEVECEKAGADPRCADDQFIRSLMPALRRFEVRR